MDQQRKDGSKWVGFVSNSAWYIYIHRWDVIRCLIENGYHILIIAPEDRHVEAFQTAGIKYIPLEFSNKSLSVSGSLDFYRRLKEMYLTYRPACVFHYAIKANIFGNFAAKSTGVSCVSIIIGVGYSFLKNNWLYYLVKNLYKRALRIPKEVWFINKEDGAFFIQHRLVAEKKVHILNGEGINTGYYTADYWKDVRDYAGFSFIIATRFLYSKGIATIADAISILKNKGYEFRCMLLGAIDPGHPDAIPETVISTWQQEDIFEVVAFVEDVRPWLAKSDCFLLPSYYNEGLPRCLMEAASMQLPIITTRQKGCRETIAENVSGLFCNIKDPVDLAGKMETMMNLSPEQRLEMGKAGRLLMQQKFAIERICGEYLRVLKKVAD